MRLLFVSHSLPPEGRPLANIGGMQRVAQKLHESLIEKRRASALHYDSLLLRSPWRTLHVKVPFFLARAGWRLRRLAKRESVDVVLFSSMVTASLAVPLQSVFEQYGVRTAAIVHGLDVTTPFAPYQWFVPRVFDALDTILPVSRATKEACLARGAAPEALQVVPNGIDVDRFRTPESRTSARAALQTAFGHRPPAPPPEALLLCSVGRQVERKGTAWFVDRVMPKLPNDVHYWIAGDGPQTSQIERAIDRHDLHSRVRHLGRVSEKNLARLYRGSDLFVMPNLPVEDDMEGFGIVLLEAGQCGTPAIAAKLDGIQDVVTEGINGHLVPPQDPDAFAQAIEQFRGEPERLDALSRRAIRHTEETFGWDSVARKYISVLRTVRKHGRPVGEPAVEEPVASTVQ